MNTKDSNPTSDTRFPRLYRQAVKNFYVIGHRGASFVRPENSLSAFEKAYEMGADMIELDVQLTKDRIPVVFHDITLNRLTRTTGTLSSLNLDELQKADIGVRFHKSFAGTRIPTLEDVLKWAAGRISLNIEIKQEAVEPDPPESSSNNEGIERKVIDLVRKYGMQQHVVISSFSYLAVSRIKILDGETYSGLLFNTKSRPDSGKHPYELLEAYGADSFHCNWMQLKSRWLRELTEQGIPVFVYTVNSKRKMRKLISSGVTGIFTDRPDRLLEVLTETDKG